MRVRVGGLGVREPVSEAVDLDLDDVDVGSRVSERNAPRSISRSCASDGSHSASSSATESSAHSVVPLKARRSPVG